MLNHSDVFCNQFVPTGLSLHISIEDCQLT